MKIMRGSSKYGDVILNIDGKKVIKGSSKYGDVILNFDGNKFMKGSSKYGNVIANVEGGRMSGGAAAVFLLLMWKMLFSLDFDDIEWYKMYI